jgi:protoporphyrinogen oxidase
VLAPIDTVIVGAGPAGLAAAYRLSGRGDQVRVYESSDDVGGRTRSADVAGERINTGAMFVYVGTETSALCRELNITTVPVTPPTFGVSRAGRTVLARTDGELVEALGLPPVASRQLADVLTTIRDEYHAFADQDGLATSSSQLAHVSFAEHLGQLHPAVDGILRNIVQGGSTAAPEALSAQYALRYASSYLVRAAGHRDYIPLGMQEISRQLAARLQPGVLNLHTTVESVTPTSGGYSVAISTPHGTDFIEANHVILAVPGPLVANLVPSLPEWKKAAIERVPSNPTVTLGVVLDSTDRPNWDDIFVIAAVDAAFNLVLQPRAGADRVPSEYGRTTMLCYLSGDEDAARAAASPDDDDDETIDRWLQDFYGVVPDARGRVLGVLLTKWPHCFAHVAPDRDSFLHDIRRPVDGLHFAGDYASSTAGSHGSVAEGFRAADEISTSRLTARTPAIGL